MRVFLLTFALVLFQQRHILAQEESAVNWFDKNFSAKVTSVNHEESLRLLRDKLKIAHEEHNAQAEARAMVELGAFHFIQLKNYGESLNWLIKALILEDSSELNHEKILTFTAISRVFEDVTEFQKSINQLNQANAIAKEDNVELSLFILNERGRVYAKMHMFDLATNDYQQVLQAARNADLREWEGDALFAIGKLETELKDFDKALKNHKDALTIRRELHDRSKEAESLNSIGMLYLLMKNYERTKANFEVAINIRKKLNDLTSVAETYNNMGLLLIAQKDYKGAIGYINFALQSSQEAVAQEQTMNAYENLSLAYKELGDFKQALRYRELYSEISDFVQQEKDRNALLEIENTHAIEEKEAKIEKLAADMSERERTIETQQKEKNFLVLVIALATAIGLLILYLYFLIRRTNRKLKQINETKDKLFSIIGHDLKAPLNSLTAFSSLLIHHGETLTKDEIKMLSGDVDKSLKNLFNLLENLLEWGRSQTGNIDFTPIPFDLATVLHENHELLKALAQKKNIAFVNMNTNNIKVNAHRNSINTVVRNLINNAIKFTPEGGQITISAEHIGNQVKVTVADTGLGMSKEALKRLFIVGTKHSTLGTAQEKGTGLGLIICKDFVEKNGGTIGAESVEGKGSQFYFTVPASQ